MYHIPNFLVTQILSVHFLSNKHSGEFNIIMPISQMRMRRLRRMKLSVPGHPGGKWQRWISNEDLWIIKQNKTCFPHFTVSFLVLILELLSHRKVSLPLGRLCIRQFYNESYFNIPGNNMCILLCQSPPLRSIFCKVIFECC